MSKPHKDREPFIWLDKKSEKKLIILSSIYGVSKDEFIAFLIQSHWCAIQPLKKIHSVPGKSHVNRP